MDKQALPTVLSSKKLAKTRLFHIEERHLRFSNGTEVNYERLVSSSQGAVLIVPMLDEDTVLLIREYACGLHHYELALPKGRIESGEDIFKAAERELREEVSYGAKTLTHLSSVSLAPGYFSHITHIILAEDLFPAEAEGDEPEDIVVVPWKLSDIESAITRDDFTEARSIAALFLARNAILKRKA